MKTCPYCAEEIKDEAIKCRYCRSWLVDEIPPGADGPPPWETKGPVTEATEVVEERASEVAEEPAEEGVAAAATTTAAAATAATITGAPTPVEQAPTPETQPISTVAPTATSPAPTAVPPTFTHSGVRYLLGYGPDYFGIWDRQSPSQPLQRFPRTDEGWQDAWKRFVSIESNWMEVKPGS